LRPGKLVMLLLMGLILSTVGGYLLLHMRQAEQSTVPELETNTDADLCLKEIHYVETKGNGKEWELRAKCAEHFLRDDITLLHDMKVTFFADDGRVIIMRGDKGSVKKRKDIEVTGNVVITSSDGYRIVTESLRYDGVKRQISTEDPVVIERQGMRLRGVGVLVDLGEEKLYLQKNVQTVIEG